MKLEPVTWILMFVCAMYFWDDMNGKNWSFELFRPNLHQLGLFHPFLYVNVVFRAISITSKCNFSIYLDIQAIPTLYAFYWFFVLIPAIHSFFYLTTTLLRSDIFWHWKAYSSHSFQPTGIGLGSLWRGNRCVFPIISV